MEFLVRFEPDVPDGTPASELAAREGAEAAAAARLAADGHLIRLWKVPAGADETATVGLYRAESEAELERMLGALPLYDWLRVATTKLESHPNDPAVRLDRPRTDKPLLPQPRLTLVYRLQATLGDPLELGEIGQVRRRIVPLTGGTFAGPKISGTLLPGASADWQTILPDATALGDIRYTLKTTGGYLLYVRARGVRHGSPDVLARLGGGEDVNANEYVFRTSTQIETGAGPLDWLNKGIFISVGGRSSAGVVYETYLVE